VTRSTPALLRLIAVAALAGFWLAAGLVLALAAAWPDGVVMMLAVAAAAAAAVTLSLILRLYVRRFRSTRAGVRRQRGYVPSTAMTISYRSPR
jgi:hypothetical protein